MTMHVIGSGLGRTGTMSTKLALEQLGLGPCHHMFEVFKDAANQMPLWIRANAGEDVWDDIFSGFNSAVDHPVAQYYALLADRYPEAKILHTVRDPDQWFDSTQATIFAPDSPVFDLDAPSGRFFKTIADWYGVDMHDRAQMTAFFRRHTEDVVATIPKERLLVWNIQEGWEPLCKFLGVPVPDGPVPRENDRESFNARRAARAAAINQA